jgi:hypothetical protein
MPRPAIPDREDQLGDGQKKPCDHSQSWIYGAQKLRTSDTPTTQRIWDQQKFTKKTPQSMQNGTQTDEADESADVQTELEPESYS